ncbi:hypothetical protein AGMMS50255_7960 [Spirochaetia bacterium]|nr:hypothetical protein AGMMS50255_7960 [Spirochaetia bacterium]
MNVNCLLFNDFETLDLFGPVEVFGKVDGYNIHYYSMNGGNIISKQNTQINTENINTMDLYGILLIFTKVLARDILVL